MNDTPTERIPYSDGCERCYRSWVPPLISTKTREGQVMVCHYLCHCGHTWFTSWSVGFVEGWDAA